MNESYFEAITLVSLPMRGNLRSWVAIGWKVKRKSSGQSQPRTYFCSNCGSRPLCLPWFSWVYTVGISWVFDSNERLSRLRGQCESSRERSSTWLRPKSGLTSEDVLSLFGYDVLEWFCLKDQARYRCICEVFFSKDFAYYFISFRLFNQMFKVFFLFQPLDYTVLSFLLNKKSWFTLYVSAVVSNVPYDFILSFEFKIYSWICITLCSTTCSLRVQIFETRATWHTFSDDTTGEV